MERTKQPINFYNTRYALEIFSSEAYLSVNKRLLYHYGPNIAIYLSNLVDKYKYFKDKKESNGDWFYIIHKNQKEQTGLTITKIRSCKLKLKQDGILTTLMKGSPPKEWYKINFQLLLQLIIPAPVKRQETLRLNVRKTDEYGISKDIPFKDNIYNDSESKKKTATERSLQYLPLANYLSNIIRRNKNITHLPRHLKTWSNEIRKLSEENSISYKRIKAALQWYRKNIGGQYIPVIESGRSLREKFAKLEAAVARNDFITHEKPKTIMRYGEDWDLRKDGNYYNDEGQLLHDA